MGNIRRRNVQIVAEQPDRKGSKAPLFAYGYGAVSKMAGVSIATLKRHEAAGRIDMGSLYSVIRYLQRSEQRASLSLTVPTIS